MAIDYEDFLYGPSFPASPLRIRAARAMWDCEPSFEERVNALPEILERYDLDGSDFLTDAELEALDVLDRETPQPTG